MAFLDLRLLNVATPPTEYLSFPDFLKATPSQEGDTRYLFMEASNEQTDLQSERVLAKALADSAEYYKRFGNVDIQHRSLTGLATGDPNYYSHEIGRPEEVKADGTRTFVKAVIYSGDTPVAEQANQFWDSVTKVKPAIRWYPSVAGKINDVDKTIDPDTKRPIRIIKAVTWCNIGLSRTPVNAALAQVSTVPFGILAKCWGADGLDLTKALEAGYGTDMATLTGGGAVRKQSLDYRPQSYWDFRERLARDVRAGHAGKSTASILEYAKSYGLDDDVRGEWTDRLMGDLKAGMEGKN